MNARKLLNFALPMACIFMISSSYAADRNPLPSDNGKQKQSVATQPETLKEKHQLVVADNMPKYVPPFRGAPRNRLGGGTRSIDKFRINAVSPEHTGLTISAQPVLYFMNSSPEGSTLEFTLVEYNAEEPLIETQFESNGSALQYIDLKKLNIVLKQDTEYQWYITIIVNPKLRAKDIVSGGSIMYITPSTSLSNSLAQAKNNKAGILAKNSIWYDAVHATQRSTQTQKQFLSLIQQVGLNPLQQ